MTDDDALVAMLVDTFKRQAQWWLCPYGEWTEGDYSRVIFDRAYRPICRVNLDDEVEIVRSDEFIHFKEQRWFHTGFGSKPTPEVKAIVAGIIQRHGLAPELGHRLRLLQRGRLLRWSR